MPDPAVEPKIVHDPAEVRLRLMELGLTLEQVQEAKHTFSRASASANPLGPKTEPGLRAWIETVGFLREIKVLDGWEAVDVMNFPIVVNRKTGVAISVTSGDERTGLLPPGGQPSTRNPKGFAMVFSVTQNARQLELPHPAFDTPTRVKKEKAGYMTWLLLIRCDGPSLRAEVSLPSHIDGKWVRGWSERIIIPDDAVERAPQSRRKPEHDPVPSIDVEVTRKNTGA